MARRPLEIKVEDVASESSVDREFVSRSEFDAIKERLELLESAFSSFVVPQHVGGKVLPRCACGDFATRLLRLHHRFSGTHFKIACDACDFAHPIRNLEGSELSVEAIEGVSEKMVERARELNRARAPFKKGIAA